MSLQFRYSPPHVNAGVVLHAAAEEAVEVAADVVFEESQRLVPEDTGALKASGTVTRDGLDAVISYGNEDGAGRDGQDTAAYAVVQHERLDFEHENGQAKFLEVPLHSQAERVGEVVAATIRKAFGS